MSILTADCPRCGVQKMTFDLLKSQKIDDVRYEAFCVCKKCNKSTVFVIVSNGECEMVLQGSTPEGLNIHADDCFDVEKFVNQASFSAKRPPEHLPEDIKRAFGEGATCFAIKCFNAACVMFRSCVDLATQSRFAEEVKKFNSHEKRSLGRRLDRLFKEGHLSPRLKVLSECIKDDGDDGAHKGGLGKVEAESIQDFAILLLEELYTTPRKVELAKERTTARRDETENKT